MAGADPGFSVGRAPTLQGAPTYDFGKISKKQHEIERKCGPWGAGMGLISHRMANNKFPIAMV